MACLTEPFLKFLRTLSLEEKRKFWTIYEEDAKTKLACARAGVEWNLESDGSALRYLRNLMKRKEIAEVQEPKNASSKEKNHLDSELGSGSPSGSTKRSSGRTPSPVESEGNLRGSAASCRLPEKPKMTCSQVAFDRDQESDGVPIRYLRNMMERNEIAAIQMAKNASSTEKGLNNLDPESGSGLHSNTTTRSSSTTSVESKGHGKVLADAGKLPEKSTLMRANDGKNAKSTFAGDKLSKSSKGVTEGEDQGKSRQSVGSRNSYAKPRPGNRRHMEHSNGPPISAFQSMSISPANSRPFLPMNQNMSMPQMAPPPPPYTPNPPPSHSASGVMPLMHMNLGGRNPKPQSERDRGINYTKEIKKKEQELEQLKIHKLRHEASEAWEKLQSTVTQLAEMKTPTPQLFPLAVGGHPEMHHQNIQTGGISRGGKNTRNRGARGSRGRNQSRGTNRETKMAPAKSTDKGCDSRTNIY